MKYLPKLRVRRAPRLPNGIRLVIGPHYRDLPEVDALAVADKIVDLVERQRAEKQ